VDAEEAVFSEMAAEENMPFTRNNLGVIGSEIEGDDPRFGELQISKNFQIRVQKFMSTLKGTRLIWT